MRAAMLVILALGWAACSSGDGGLDPSEADVGTTDTAIGDTMDKEVCIPDCKGKYCGDDGCGGSCGECEDWQTCWFGYCDHQDVSDCEGKVCGDDTYGGTCGECGIGEYCSADQTECIPCVPDCYEKECGDNGCEGSCGDCKHLGELAFCTADNKCECTPDCINKVCGDDGCNGSCGDCQTDATCYKGECSCDCCDMPTAWDPTGLLTSLLIPEPGTFSDTCPDVSGDGKGDNGLSALASMINPELTKAFENGDLGILFEFLGVNADATDFTLVGLVGESETEGDTSYLIDEAGYDPMCKPLISFPNSSITDGELAASPSIFTLDLAVLGVEEVPLVLSIGDTQISGTVNAVGADGVEVTDGVLAGILSKELVTEALDAAKEVCNVPEPESFCTYLKVADQFLPMLCGPDLDEGDCIDGNKIPVCFQFTLGKAIIVGYKPGE